MEERLEEAHLACAGSLAGYRRRSFRELWKQLGQLSGRVAEIGAQDSRVLRGKVLSDGLDERMTRDRVDQLGVFIPGGLALQPGAESSCQRPDGRAEPDPCIASPEFLENGDGRLVVLASDPATG